MDTIPATPAPAGAILRGMGRLRRHRAGNGEETGYSGHLLLGGRTIELRARVEQDGQGKYFELTATLDPNSYTEAELDRLLEARTGSGFGVAQRSSSTPFKDDPIPFGASV